MPWILGSSVKDLGAFYLSPLALIIISFGAPEALRWPILVFLVYQWLDVGHAFPTMFRVASKWGANRNFIVLFPLAILTILTAGFFFSPRWTLVAVVYLTVFHHVRQFYGISRWYQYLNGRLDKWSGRYLYALTWLPVLLGHFREDLRPSSLTWAQLPHFEDPRIEAWLKVALALAWTGWAIHEGRVFLKNGLEVNRVLSVLVPSFLHYWCFTKAPTVEAMLLPLLAVHALTYIFVVDQKTARGFWNLPALFAAALLGSVLVQLMEDFADGRPFGLALALTPTVWHYVIDGFIWKKRDLI